MGFIHMALLVINIISFIITVLFFVFGVYEYIMGPANAGKLLKRLRIPLSYKQTLVIGFVCFGIAIITNILRAKLMGTL